MSDADHDLLAAVDGLLHEETQVHGEGIDLTVNEVFVVDDAGRVDFGGSELEPARTHPHETRKRRPEDDYGWWHLDAGQYLIEYNESLATDRSSSRPVRRCSNAGPRIRRGSSRHCRPCRCR